MPFFTDSIILPTLVLISALSYWAYKKFREPSYNPGDVSKLSENSSFDRPELAAVSTSNTWRMPDGIDIYHFPLEVQSKKANDAPTILGLHGGPAMAPAEPWKICQMLPNFHLYHARGCGKSTRPFAKFPTPGRMWPGMKILEETLGLGAQIADIERIRRRLGIEKISLVGHSFGGFIATMYATEFPEYVESLVLLVPAAVLQLPTPKGEDGDIFALVEKKIKERGNEDYIADYKAFMKLYLDFNSLPNATDESLAKRHNDFAIHFGRADIGSDGEYEDFKPELTGGMACYATFLSMGIEHNYQSVCQERLRDSKFPVAIVHGAKDIVPENTSRKYMDLFPSENVTFEVLQEAKHSMFDHARIAEIIKETLARR